MNKLTSAVLGLSLTLAAAFAQTATPAASTPAPAAKDNTAVNTKVKKHSAKKVQNNNKKSPAPSAVSAPAAAPVAK